MNDEQTPSAPEAPEAPQAAAAPQPSPEEPPRKTVEDWAKAHDVSAWNLAGARVLLGGGIGRLVTEQQFNEAVKAFTTIKVG